MRCNAFPESLHKNIPSDPGGIIGNFDAYH
jgi:hypothetical protein